ncbi:hypothetical protein B0H11DRAFT_1967028 [Mycena galericulata]|nr:hypothetical protein B0H11DRAFT_1967028 [Mycena galericulata]
MERAGNPHHQRALDMLSGRQEDENDDEERIRRPPEPTLYEDRRETIQSTWTDGASVYSNSGADEYPYPERGGEYPYPESVIDMSSFSNPPRDLAQDPAAPFGPRNPRLSFWDRFRGNGRPHVGWTQSLIAIGRSSWLNILLVFVPVAWALHWVNGVSHVVQFAFCFIAIIPLNLALYCGRDIGDLVVITLNKCVHDFVALAVEFTTSTVQLRLLQATVVGVVLLRLLLVPACAFISGGARVPAQELHPHLADLNQTLLTTGVLSLLLPAAFFAALNSSSDGGSSPNAVSDTVRGDILKVSRGLAAMLLVVYLCSRIFLHNPPGLDSGLHQHKDAPAEFKEMVEKMAEEEPEVNPWACLILLVLTVALMAVTAEFLVESIEPMRKQHEIKEEWFGLVLLPFVSFSAEFILSLVYYVRVHLQHYFGVPLSPPKLLAESRSIDLSIQFLSFLDAASGPPRVVLLLSAGFLVNYVTADAKTNWALTAWFYPGQSAVSTMLSCGSVQEVLAANGVPPNSTFTYISFSGFHATLDDSQINNFTDHLRDLKRLYDVLKQIETSS